jgi:hypothetical protein
VIDLGAVFGLPRYDERRARLVDQDRVHLVDDGVRQAALKAILDMHRHVVAQVVEAEFVIGAVCDIGGIGAALVLGLHVRQVDADGQTQEPVDLAHPLRVAVREVVVYRDDVDAFPGQGVQVRGQRGDEGLALAGFHLGDLAVVEHHAAEELNVEMAHAQRALRRFAHNPESFGQQLVQRSAVGVALSKLLGLAAQLRIAQLRKRGLEGIDLGDGARILL